MNTQIEAYGWVEQARVVDMTVCGSYRHVEYLIFAEFVRDGTACSETIRVVEPKGSYELGEMVRVLIPVPAEPKIQKVSKVCN